MINSSCTVVEPGVVEVSNARGRVALGEPDGRMTERVQALAAAMTSEFLVCEAVPRIRERIWTKLMLNFSAGPLNVLTQASTGQIFGDPELEATVRRAADEIAAIARAVGCSVTPNVDDQKARATTGPAHTPSILQDLQLGRPMEVDAMFGVPLDIARLTGVPTPTLDLLVAMVKLRARGGGAVLGGRGRLGRPWSPTRRCRACRGARGSPCRPGCAWPWMALACWSGGLDVSQRFAGCSPHFTTVMSSATIPARNSHRPPPYTGGNARFGRFNRNGRPRYERILGRD
ncbi:MAG: ketopantoate reductase C-terminal domain-containing protein [Acetobacteraceae bacterium]